MQDERTSVSPTMVRCVQCGYDLTGASIGGSCSECGRPVAETFRAVHAPSESRMAIAALIVGIASCVLCPPTGPVAIVLAVLARKKIAQGGYTEGSRVMVSAGLITGIVGTILLGVFVLVNLAAV